MPKVSKSQMHDLLNQYDIPVEDNEDINTIHYYSAVFIIKNSELTENLFGIKFSVTSDPKSNYALATQMHRKIKKITEGEEDEEEDEDEEEEGVDLFLGRDSAPMQICFRYLEYMQQY